MATDVLLQLDGIVGESGDSVHKDAIEIESFAWGAANAGTSGTGGGGGAGKGSFRDLRFTIASNKASPKLMFACASGQHIPRAVLTVRRPSGLQEDFYVVTLTAVLVSSYRSAGGWSAGGAVDVSIPSDEFALNFTAMTFKYLPRDRTGQPLPAQETSWDVKKNAKA